MEIVSVSQHGEIEFDDRYDGNPLVNAMCVGVIDHDMIQKGTAKGEGNSVIYVGLKQVVMVFMVQLLHLKS